MAARFNDDDPEDLARRMEEAAGRLERLATTWQQDGIERALDQALKRTRRDLEQSISRLVQDSITSAFGGSSSGAGGLASLLAGLVPGFARGGVLSKKTPVAHAAEAGPEVVLPLRRGRDGRLGVVMEAARNQTPQPVSVTIQHDAAQPASVDLDPAMTDAVTAAVTRAMEDAIDQRLAQHQQPGGLFHSWQHRGWR